MILNDLRLSESVPFHHYWFQFPFFTRRYNVLWEHHKFIGLIGQVTYYQNLNVSTREKTTLTTQINSDCHITWLSLILIDYLEKTETWTGSRDVLNTTELDSVHALQYISMFPTLVKTNFYSELLRYNSIFNFQEVFKNLFFW